ncbi:hypothetical protein [Okeania sp.]|uniref:hypothetical protein n=1 Tax=Okeania sp. TaxID=3100323 RepID=UPI002B4AC551|nr:hypothetical protein [Okeania sp.]MEB3343256.1 hypothetical protein [Okeania sp.]
MTRDDQLQWEKALEIIRENQPCFVSNVDSRLLSYDLEEFEEDIKTLQEMGRL